MTQIYTTSIQTIFILDQFFPILRNRKKKHAKRKTTLKAKKKGKKEIKENHPQHPCALTKNMNIKKVKRETRQKKPKKQVAAFVPCVSYA